MDFSCHRGKDSDRSLNRLPSTLNRGLILALTLGMTLSCSSPSSSAQTEVISATPAHSNSPNVALDPSQSPATGNSSPSMSSPLANTPQLKEMSEVEMLRMEALEVAIVEENFTPLTSSCRMGECMESYYTFTNLQQESQDERLYTTEVLLYRSGMSAPIPTGEWIFSPAPTQVLCSSDRPMVINFDGEEYILTHLSPGNQPPGFQTESDALYWAICHEIQVTELTNELRSELARQWGYDLNREPNQTRQNFIELIEP